MTPRLGKLPSQQKAAWLWYYPQDWRGFTDKLAASGHNIVMPKGGIDDMGDGVPSLWTQWEPQRLEYARSKGVEPYLFVYSWMGRQHGVEAETNAIVQLCRTYLPHRVVLNFEVETDNAPDSEVAAFIDTLDSKLVGAFGSNAPALDNSSVPSWDGGKYGGSRYHNVNYEAISARTVVDWYQNYWDANDVPNGYNWQDYYQRQRQAVFPGKVVVPSWIVGKDVMAFADWANSKGYAGIAGWESGNAAYNFSQVANAFPHLKNEIGGPIVDDEQAVKAGLCWNDFTNLKAYNARVLGNPQHEGVVDLSELGLDSQARFLECEKGVIWSDGKQVDYFHRGQFEDFLKRGKAVQY